MSVRIEDLDGSDVRRRYMSKCELPARNKRNATIVWSFWLIVLFLILLFGASCKKKEITKAEPVVIQPSPKGLMEGSYAWYAGDSATADLVLTTNVLNCAYCVPQYSDVYTYNLFIPWWSVQSNYLSYPTGSKIDSLYFATQNGKVFKYVRK